MDYKSEYIFYYHGIPDNRFIITNNGDVIYIKTGNALKKYLGKDGFYYVNIGYRPFAIHRLVAWFFVPGRSDDKNIVKHINGIKTDNRAENLEWCSRSDNVRHIQDKGLSGYRYGENNPNSTITSDDVDEVCRLLLQHEGNCKEVIKICKENKICISYQMLQQIKHKKTWTDVSDEWFGADRFKINHLSTDDVCEICRSLKRNNYDVNTVIDELNGVIPYITYNRVRSIMMKRAHIDISDTFFTLDDVLSVINKK